MSWHYLQESAAGFWEESCSDGIPDAPSKSSPIADRCYSPDKETGPLTDSRSGMMFAPLTACIGAEKSTSLPAASPAKISVAPENKPELQAKNQDFGKNSLESLERSNPENVSSKIRPTWRTGAWASSSAILPKWGIMRRGELYPLKTVDSHMNAKGCGFSLPTPLKSGATIGMKFKAITSIKSNFGATRDGLLVWMLKNHNCQMTPMATEYLMGFPISWTDLAPLEMRKFRSWLLEHIAFCEKF